MENQINNTPPAAPAAPVEATTPKAPVEAPKTYKFELGKKEDGTPLVEEFDEATIKTLIGKGRGADQKFQESSAMRKQVEAVIQNLKTNPGRAILNKSLGHKPTDVIGSVIEGALQEGYSVKEIKEFLSEKMYEWIQEENLDPKERENLELKRKLEAIETEKKTKADEEQQKILDKLTEDARQKFSDDITTSLKDSGLPKTAFTVKRMAYYMDQAYKLQKEYADQGVKLRDPVAKDILPLVRKEYEEAIKELYGSADAETLIKLLGEENINKVRKYDVEKLKAGPTKEQKAPAAKQVASSSSKKDKFKSSREFFRQREAEIRELEKGK